MNIPRPHNFWMRVDGVEWHWLAMNGNEVANYSGYLGRQVLEDRAAASSRVQLCDGVSGDAMKVIISAIPSNNNDDDDDLPVLFVNDLDPEHGFNELLSLAIGCWKFQCAIPPVCQTFANDFHTNWTVWYGHEFYEGRSETQINKAVNWMFIALVFDWEKIFRKTSRFVVSKNKERDNNPNLPQDFQDLVSKTRKRKVLQTYSFIQKSWMSFYDPSNNELQNKIHERFLYRYRIELQSSLPKDVLKQVNADTLLLELAAIVKENEVQSPISQTSQLVFDEPALPEALTQGTGRTTPFGPVAVSLGKGIIQAAKKTMKHKRPEVKTSRNSTSSEDSWRKLQSLEKEINDFRAQSLDGISISNQKYTKLREEHIMPTVPLRSALRGSSVLRSAQYRMANDYPRELG